MTFEWSPKILWFDILISNNQWRSRSLAHSVLALQKFGEVKDIFRIQITMAHFLKCLFLTFSNFDGYFILLNSLRSSSPTTIFLTHYISIIYHLHLILLLFFLVICHFIMWKRSYKLFSAFMNIFPIFANKIGHYIVNTFFFLLLC